MTHGADAIVIGGGVMGCSAALHLADAGCETVVLERSVPGAEASSAATGMLAAAIEAHPPGPALSLGVASRAMHADLAERLREDHGIDVGYRRCGVTRVAFTEEEAAALEQDARAMHDAGVRLERLDAAGARRREPGLGEEVLAAVDLPDEAQLEPPVFLRALAIAVEHAGARFRTGAFVQRVVIDGDRVRGVAFADGSVLEAEHVVVAAGSWTNLVGGLRLPPGTIEPVRGQIVATETRPPLLRRIVFGAGGYVCTRPDGRVLCGSTQERVGFRRGVTFEGMRRVLEIACRIAPRLAEATPKDAWASFRPGTPDGLPLVGGLGPRGLWVASGHYRNGILLAPVTGKIVADLVLGRESVAELSALDPTRFGLIRDGGADPVHKGDSVQ